MCDCDSRCSCNMPCPEKPKGHPHAELMMQYAEDAKVHEHPWELWEHRVYSVINYRNWEKMKSSPAWSTCMEYRRKPRTININGYEVPEPDCSNRSQGPTLPRVKGYVVDTTSESGWYYKVPSTLDIKRGLVHNASTDAELHAKALLSFTRK